MGMQGLRATSKQSITCTRSSLVLGDLLLPLAGLLTTSHPSKLGAAGPKSGREEGRLGTGVDPALGSR